MPKARFCPLCCGRMTRFYEKYGSESKVLAMGWYCLGHHEDRLGGILIFDKSEDEPLRLLWELQAKERQIDHEELLNRLIQYER